MKSFPSYKNYLLDVAVSVLLIAIIWALFSNGFLLPYIVVSPILVGSFINWQIYKNFRNLNRQDQYTLTEANRLIDNPLAIKYVLLIFLPYYIVFRYVFFDDSDFAEMIRVQIVESNSWSFDFAVRYFPAEFIYGPSFSLLVTSDNTPAFFWGHASSVVIVTISLVFIFLNYPILYATWSKRSNDKIRGEKGETYLKIISIIIVFGSIWMLHEFLTQASFVPILDRQSEYRVSYREARLRLIGGVVGAIGLPIFACALAGRLFPKC